MTSPDLDSFLTEAERWLNQTVLANVDDALEAGEKLVRAAEALKRTHAKAVGPLYGRLKGRMGFLNAMERVPWHPLAGGQLCVGHRPSNKKLEALRLQGATHILTLLTGGEGALAVEKSVKSSGLQWLWFVMEGGDPLPASRDIEARKLFEDMKALLEQGAHIYIHCSAGIHRTGMLTNGFLRFLGHSQSEANEILAALRQETAEGVGFHRIAWGDRFG